MKQNFISDQSPNSPRESYRSYSPPRSQRWDSQRFALEQERGRARQLAAEQKSYATHSPPRNYMRERSIGPKSARRGPPSFVEDDVLEPSHPIRERQLYQQTHERHYSPPNLERRARSRPSFLRRQSSLDTFDRKPLARYENREMHSPPARYREPVLPPRVPIPLPIMRQPHPARRHEREDYNDYQPSELEFHDDSSYRGYPDRTREREHTKRRGRRKSTASRRRNSVRSRSASSSIDSNSSSFSEHSARSARSTRSNRSQFPKKGKTKIPTKLVSRKAIIDLGYPFEENGDFTIIMRALGSHHIDELIKLSDEYKNSDRVKSEIIQERTELYTIARPPTPHAAPAPSVHVSEPAQIASLPPPPAPVFVATPAYAAPATQALAPPQHVFASQADPHNAIAQAHLQYFAAQAPPQHVTPQAHQQYVAQQAPPQYFAAQSPPQQVTAQAYSPYVAPQAPPQQSPAQVHPQYMAPQAPPQNVVAQVTPQQVFAIPAPQTPVSTVPTQNAPTSGEIVLHQAAEKPTSESTKKPAGNALTPVLNYAKDERAINAEIKALEAEKEVLRAQRRIDRLRLKGNGELIVSEQTNRDGSREEVTILRREDRSRSRPAGVRIEKDRKGLSSRMLKAMLYTQT